MTHFHPIVLLIDVDNSLLDNDGIHQELKIHLLPLLWRRLVRMCSGLKRTYRQFIIGDRPEVRLVYLRGGR